jgi:hypothetical protein
MTSENTIETLQTGSIQDLELMLYEMKEAIKDREDVEEVLSMMASHGLHVDNELCEMTRPEHGPAGSY